MTDQPDYTAVYRTSGLPTGYVVRLKSDTKHYHKDELVFTMDLSPNVVKVHDSSYDVLAEDAHQQVSIAGQRDEGYNGPDTTTIDNIEIVEVLSLTIEPE